MPGPNPDLPSDEGQVGYLVGGDEGPRVKTREGRGSSEEYWSPKEVAKRVGPRS